jgi:flavin reductase
MSEMEASLFRSAMRKFAAGVAVITTSDQDANYGMTATAICSVSADPPTVLIVVNKTARTHPHIEGAGSFAVNILSREQRWLAERFSGKLIDQFDGVPHAPGKLTAAPIVRDAAAYLECELLKQIDVATHTIFVGRVVHCDVSTSDPLAYWDGRYAQVAALAATAGGQ